MVESTTVVDASNHILGRLASIIAKRLLRGERIAVVNAEKAMISGRRSMLFDDYLRRLEIKSRINPRHTPRHPRRPETIFKRVVRGMLPRRKTKGFWAVKRLRVYVGNPEPYGKMKALQFKEALITRPPAFYTPLGELAERLGWKRVVSS